MTDLTGYGFAFIIAVISLIFCFAPAKAVSSRETSGGTRAYLSIINIFAAFAVVMLHTNGIVYGPEANSSQASYIISHAINSFCNFAAPVFYMITGATLMDYAERYSTKEYFKKRLKKTFIPFIIWSFIAFLFCKYYMHFNVSWSPLEMIDKTFNYGYVNLYWFFMPLFGIYLLLPVLTDLNGKYKVFRYMLIAGVISVMAIPLICRFLNIEFNVNLKLSAATGFSLYPVLGYFLDRSELTRKVRIIIYTAGLSGLALFFAGTLVLKGSNGYYSEFSDIFMANSNLPCFLWAGAVFVFFKQIFGSKTFSEKALKLIKTLSGLSFGIYLIHFYILMPAVRELGIDCGSLIWKIGGAIVIYALSAGIVFLLKKIPLLKRIVP